MPSAAPTFSDLSNTTITVYTTGTSSDGLQVVSTLSALAGLATSTANKAAIVQGDDDGNLRIYKWDSASTTADNGLGVIAPSDGGTGRWILQL
jgi:hypothetical protein